MLEGDLVAVAIVMALLLPLLVVLPVVETWGGHR